MNENLYQKAKGLTIIFFLIFLMAVMKTVNFNVGSLTGAITYETQMGLVGLILILTVLAGMIAAFLRSKFGFG